MKKYLLISAVALGFVFNSCDDYLDINYDPTAPSEKDLTADLIFPGTEMNLASSYGNYLRIVGGYYSQHFAQAFGTSNYLDYSKFTMSATRSSSLAYRQLNLQVLNNLKTIMSKAEEEEAWGTYLAATVIRAFTYQAMVDCYGELPYTEALDATNPTPKYDDGKTIYEGVLAEIDEALSKVSENDLVCTNFLFPDERASAWIQFANALKLKLLMRMSGVVDVQSQLDALVAEGNFPIDDIALKGCWLDEAGKMSPYYAEEFSTKWGSPQINVIANIALVGTMQTDSYTDPRLAAFFEKNESGNFTGGVSGTNFSTTKIYKTGYWCRPKASYDMPVYFITVPEIEFFLAEYYAKKGSHDAAAEHYAAAITASFDEFGVAGAEANIAQNPYDKDNYKKSIGIAKWIALAGTNDYEAWCELRRLDYPAFGNVKGEDIYNVVNDVYTPGLYKPGTLYTPIQYFGELGANKVLERFPYAESSSARNSNAPEFPGYAEPVFWGK